MTTELAPTSSLPEEHALQQRVMKKVARRLIPFLGIAYLLNYLDRSNIAFAKLTMSADLGLTETMYGLASGLFFIGYIFFEVPSNLALQRFGARRWIARIMVSWGLVATLMAFVPTAGWLYTARIVLGIAEAGFFPGIILYLTWWFPRADRARLVGLFMVFLPLSSALGSPISGLILQYTHGWMGLAGWQAMFLLQGLPTLVLGVAAWFYLTDRPNQAAWLEPEEREWLHDTMEAEQQEAAATGHHSVRASLRDGRVWALGGVYFGLGYSLFALSFFLPSIVAGFSETFDTSFSILQTGLIVAVPFSAGAIAMVLWSKHSDHSDERIWHVVLPMLLAGVTIPVALYMNSPFTTMVVITLTSIGIFSAFPVFWYLPPTFLSGPGAATGIALVNTIGAASGFLAPYATGWLVDLTGNARAGLWVVGVLAVAASLGLLAMSKVIPVTRTAVAER
ncbi:MFS transporter [Nocardioides sp. Root151]|uniref:MFS transporter n=1 Tax=Nocardioides sp. Root151 TaxID=1736475 RepID=UPI000702EA3C|nr:MFS transporter [Nocardioides sp. Root151]KQZ70613.1 MFS transporter [Nocardioides sp. Root151]